MFHFSSNNAFLLAGLVTFMALLFGLAIWGAQYIPWLDTETLSDFLRQSQGTAWALPLVCVFFVVGGIIFFPVTMMAMAVAAVFGPVKGTVYTMCGTMLSAAFMFGVGQLLRNSRLHTFSGKRFHAIDEQIRQFGVTGVIIARLIPIAPFSLVNLVAGLSSLNLVTFMAGSFLGLLPPVIANSLVGDSLAHIIANPSPQSIAYLIAGIGVWLLVFVLSNKFTKRFQHEPKS